MSPTEELYQDIAELMPSLDGWCSPERAVDLAKLVVENEIGTSVVLGVWGGRDTFALAMAHRHIGKGKVLAVDPWQATASAIGQTGANAEWWADQQKHDLVYGRFMDNMKALGLEEWIDVRRAKSAEVEPPKDIGLLIVDANHGPDSIADVNKWAPNVALKGFCYADDIAWEGGSVVIAVKHLHALGFAKMFDRDTGVFLQRTKLSLPAPGIMEKKLKQKHTRKDRALAATKRRGAR